MYHLSDVKKYLRCPRLFQLDATLPRTPFQPFIRRDEAITDLAVRMFGLTDYFCGERGDDPALAIAAMETNDWLVKARFEYGGLRIKVPFLHRTEAGWDLYFLFAGLYPHADDMQFYCGNVWVLERLGITLDHIRIIHLNADYVREEELDPARLFIISETFYNDRGRPSKNIADLIAGKMTDFAPLLQEMDASSSLPPEAPVRTSKCASRQKCRCYDLCFPAEKEEAPDSILNLIASQHRYDMQQEGRTRLRDADPERLEGFSQQYAQIMADRSGGVFTDRLALQTVLDRYRYPIAFLDFEWERYAIPPYTGMRPYDVLLFEYSLHILHEDGTVTRRSFLSIHDDRRELAESLLRDLPETGTVVAYNAFGAEAIRLRELGQQFPDLKPRLDQVISRLADMQMPFVNGLVYDTRMKGSWSLKSIMAIMDDPGYAALDIQRGMDAVYQWRLLDREETAKAEEIRDELIAYCSMDTYAMVIVYQWLMGLTGKQISIKML